jgi:hypothetical protein
MDEQELRRLQALQSIEDAFLGERPVETLQQPDILKQRGSGPLSPEETMALKARADVLRQKREQAKPELNLAELAGVLDKKPSRPIENDLEQQDISNNNFENIRKYLKTK